MSGTSPKQLEANKSGDACKPGDSCKSGDACRRNAQRSTGPQTPCDGVAAIPVLSEAEGSDRVPQTSAHKPFRGWEDIPVGRTAVAYRRLNAIERQLYRAIFSLQEDHCLSHPQPSETPPIDKN